MKRNFDKLVNTVSASTSIAGNSMDNSESRKLCKTPVAIVGMASLFPESKDLSTYWQNILDEVDCLKEVPLSRWDPADYYDDNPRASDKTYCKRGGFIPDVEFNPMEFGLPPNILEVTDVSQLLSLVLARRALEDAGYGQTDKQIGKQKDFDRETAGVVLGTVGRQTSGPLWTRLQYPIWERVLESSGLGASERADIVARMQRAYIEWQENAFPGMLSNVTAGRIANRLDFGGLNCTLDAACASSLAALKMAISELTEHRADMMLTGGIDPDNSVFTYICFSKTPALSLKQTSKPFDASSDGIMLGEGAGIVVLKRLADAERDGDRIYAVIRGLGTSSDGRYKSIYAPRPAGQVKALKRAYEDAEISPATLGLLEAHGTGTAAGDVAEFESLRTLFKEVDIQPQSIALGSVKSQIGHTKTAAGIAGLIKVALSLHHKVLPPTINIAQPNPKLKIKDSPFYLNAKLRPWIRAEDQPPRRAGVSAFGFGGTNFHAVLEEYSAEHTQPYRLNLVPQAVLLSAQTPTRLLSHCQTMLSQLKSEQADQCYRDWVEASKVKEIPLTAARLGFVSDGLTDAISKLTVAISLMETVSGERWEHPQGIFYRQTGMVQADQVVALFSGQGAQYLDMGQRLAVNFPEIRQAYGQMDQAIALDGLTPISQIVYAPASFTEKEQSDQQQRLIQTEYAQPAIGAFSMGLYKILSQAGLNPKFVAGHSFGELTALWAAGALSDDDYCFLVKSRGQAMASMGAAKESASKDPASKAPAFKEPDSEDLAGTMLAVQGNVQSIETLVDGFPDIVIANFNSPQQVVLAGTVAAIEQVEKDLQAQGFKATRLPVSAAFHTEQMSDAQAVFAQAVKKARLIPTRKLVYSNVTSEPYPKRQDEMGAILQQHMTHPVKFRQTIENMYAAGGRCFVEVGPRQILTNLVKETLGDRPYVAIALNASRQKDSDRQLREAVVQLRVAGLHLDEIDPYQLPRSLPAETNEKAKQLTVEINGASYVSEKTKLIFQQALAAGEIVNTTASTATLSQRQEHSKEPVLAISHVNSQMSVNSSDHYSSNGYSNNGKATGSHEPDINQAPSGSKPRSSSETHLTSDAPPGSLKRSTRPVIAHAEQILQTLEKTISQFGQAQNQISQIHAHYLDNHQAYIQATQQLAQQQSLLVSRSNPDSAILSSSERSLMLFHTHQQETLRVHEKYLTSQMDSSRQFFDLSHQAYQALTGQSSAQSFARPILATAVETVETVETSPATIAPQQQSSDQTSVELPVEYSINDYSIERSATTQKTAKASQTTVSAGSSLEPVETIESVETIAASSLPAASPAAVVDIAELGPVLLTIVSDKTGYPVEMLELDMDIEADLGIDSLKRVEIVSAFQEAFPNLPELSMEELAERELRTLQQIIDYMHTLLPSNQSSEAITSYNPSPSAAIVSSGTASGTQETLLALSSPVSESALSLERAQNQLLAIVSNKTGYPVEMLEMDMDIEADLGIDSLKRVEIVGAFQEASPDLPELSMEELAEAELRTLGQIADYMRSLRLSKKKDPIRKMPAQILPSV